MPLSRPIYEGLPYLYILSGATTMLWQYNPLTIVASLLLFFAGAKIFIMRSENRRTDPSKKRKKGMWPEPIYELIPFISMAISTLLLAMPHHHWMIMLSLALMAYSLYVLASRAAHRHHHVPAH